MGIIDNMMKDMIRALPVAERETLLLDMMPEMMKQVNLAEMIPNMLKQLGALINLLSLYEFLRVLIDDDEASQQLKDILAEQKDKTPAMMEMMHPMMTVVMSSFMPKMMGFMVTMMPNMSTIMPRVMEDGMIPMIKENTEIKAHMLEMMQTMFPHCATSLFPLIETDDRIAFIKKLFAIMAQSATLEMNPLAQQQFQFESAGVVESALRLDT
mgnify:CR=1 FL=1